MQPTVSILLTCYNHMRYLPAAYQSVLDQTYGDFEIIALDDGSADGTREWLSEQKEPRLRLIFNEKNLGTYGTLNVGLNAAKGEYVAILNDDDLWAPEKPRLQIQAFEKNPKVGLVHTGGWFIDETGGRHPDPSPLGFPFPHPPSGDLLGTLIDHNQIITSSVLVKKEAFDRCGEFDPAFYGCGDWHMWLRLAGDFEIVRLDEPLTFYRVHGSNAALNSQKMLEDDARIREWLTTWPKLTERTKTDPALHRMAGHNWACLGTGYTWLGQPAKGRRAYAHSLRYLPLRFKTYLRYLATFLPRKTFRSLDR